MTDGEEGAEEVFVAGDEAVKARLVEVGIVALKVTMDEAVNTMVVIREIDDNGAEKFDALFLSVLYAYCLNECKISNLNSMKNLLIFEVWKEDVHVKETIRRFIL